MTSYHDTPGSDWSTASAAGRDAPDRTVASSSSSSHRQLTRLADVKPELSKLRQQILTEEEYTDGLSEVIKRTFFPQLREFEARDHLVAAVQSEDPDAIAESVRRMREVVTPTPRRRARGATPGRTPFDSQDPSMTPSDFSETPSRLTPSSSRPASGPAPLRYDPTLSLDEFQNTYTSEDNSSFASLLEKDNLDRREKHKWAWEAERRANQKAIRGREARERLVDLTREMVEADPGGVVRLIEGAPGRPGERKLVVNKGALAGEGSRLMVEAGPSSASGPLLITDGGEGGIVAVSRKGKEKEGDYIDWEKPTADEEEENRGPKESEMEVLMEGYPFTNRNSLMFPPDANGSVDQIPLSERTGEGVVLGEPKAIRYHATRLAEVERKPERSSSSSASTMSGYPSPSRSRINAAITGTPYHSSSSTSAEPKVGGFSFVDALPTPRASTIDPKSLQELMTWGTIDSTPRAVSSSNPLGSTSAGPFRINDTSKRETLAHKMACKAKRSLADREASTKGGSSTLHRSALERSIRGASSIRGTPTSPASHSPRSSTSSLLSPAAKSLLLKSNKRRGALSGVVGGGGLRDTEAYRANEEARERARERAREIESQERMRRKRWTPSPAPRELFDFSPERDEAKWENNRKVVG